MNAITSEQQTQISNVLNRMHLTAGIGTLESACSIAAINIALSGELSDQVPDCMSRVIGVWVMHIQDAMPDEMRNSAEWKTLLPQAAGTGRNHELERLAIIQHWMWDKLQLIQPIADRNGFGIEWREMCGQRCAVAAEVAARAKAAARSARATARAKAAARSAEFADAFAADAFTAAASAAASAASAFTAAASAAFAAASAARAADAVAFAASAFTAADASEADLWPTINPPALLQKLIQCGQPE